MKPLRAVAVPSVPSPTPSRAARPVLKPGDPMTESIDPTSSALRPVAGAAPQGLYDGAHEHDSCGVAFVATLDGVPRHDIVAQALTALHNLDHRGAVGSEENTGDGAGILTQVPDAFLREVLPFELPAPGSYAVGIVFLPAQGQTDEVAAQVEEIVESSGLRVLGWREVPVDAGLVGPTALSVMPVMRQLVVAAGDAAPQESGLELERRVWLARKRIERRTPAYPVSLSTRTITYKGMLTTDQLPAYFPDLTDERYTSALAVVHSRFSTNTFPSWPLAHPYRVIAHNGEDRKSVV